MDNTIMNALDNALNNSKVGNFEGMGTSLDVALEEMKKNDPLAFESAERIMNSFTSI